jgi:hypothetical protein
LISCCPGAIKRCSWSDHVFLRNPSQNISSGHPALVERYHR